MMKPIPILMYHQVSPSPHSAFGYYTVTPRALECQMRWLTRHGYGSISFDQLVAARVGRATLPERPVLITFDDGFHESVEYAVPILQARGFSCTFYLVAGCVGGPAAWLEAEVGVTFPLLDWPTARRLRTEGVDFGAHTMTHPRLAEVSPAEGRRELVQSKDVMEQALGCTVRHLSYPFGSYDSGVRSLADEAGFWTACSTVQGLSRPDEDLLALRRIPVNGGENLAQFAARLRWGSTPLEQVHGVLRHARRGLRNWRRNS